MVKKRDQPGRSAWGEPGGAGVLPGGRPGSGRPAPQRGHGAPACRCGAAARPPVPAASLTATAPPRLPALRPRPGCRLARAPGYARRRTPSEATDQPHDLAQDPHLALAGADGDRRHGRMLGLEQDRLPVAREALDRGLAVDQRDDDVARLRLVLPAHHHEVALDDVRVDHALAADAQAEEVVAPAAQPGGIERERALAVL